MSVNYVNTLVLKNKTFRVTSGTGGPPPSLPLQDQWWALIALSQGVGCLQVSKLRALGNDCNVRFAGSFTGAARDATNCREPFARGTFYAAPFVISLFYAALSMLQN